MTTSERSPLLSSALKDFEKEFGSIPEPDNKVLPNLEEMFELAAHYGNIFLHQSREDRTFSCNIRFMTSDNVELEAKSGFRHPTVYSALRSAILSAQDIVATVNTSDSFKPGRILLK